MRILVPILACILGFASQVQADLRVAAAASLREVMEEAGKAYSSKGGEAVTFTYGSSGALMAQIKSGAPVDLFIAAAATQADQLITDGLADRASRRVVAGNDLVLIVPADAPILTFESLAHADIKRVAIGEPRTVPAGQYAEQTLKSLQFDTLKQKLIFGSNVRQVLDYVERGEVSAGIVYSTDAKVSGDKVKVAAVADPKSHDPIEYIAVTIKSSSNPSGATKFLEFLASAPGKAILVARGFKLPDATSSPK